MNYNHNQLTTDESYSTVVNRPIMSAKDVNNQQSVNTGVEYSNLSKTQLFLNKKNVSYMTQYIIMLNKKYNTNAKPAYFINAVPTYMNKWSSETRLNECETLNDDWLLILDFINKEFIKDHTFLYKTNSTAVNVYNLQAAVTNDHGEKSVKKYINMTADEYGTLDVWQQTEALAYNDLFRYGNRVPIWQKSMQIRHYEIENEGFATGVDSDRASLDNQIHGYDLSSIIKGSVQNPTMFSLP
jgi:hypothetical protein